MQPFRAPHHVIQATTSEGLAQGPYVVARVGFEPATFHTQGTEPATEPPHPTIHIRVKTATLCNVTTPNPTALEKHKPLIRLCIVFHLSCPVYRRTVYDDTYD